MCTDSSWLETNRGIPHDMQTRWLYMEGSRDNGAPPYASERFGHARGSRTAVTPRPRPAAGVLTLRVNTVEMKPGFEADLENGKVEIVYSKDVRSKRRGVRKVSQTTRRAPNKGGVLEWDQVC